MHCGNSDVPTLQRYINNYGAEAVNGVRDWKGASCLHKAAYFGDEKMTWLLLLNGAEPNLEDGVSLINELGEVLITQLMN